MVKPRASVDQVASAQAASRRRGLPINTKHGRPTKLGDPAKRAFCGLLVGSQWWRLYRRSVDSSHSQQTIPTFFQ
jgi:hypothetical protein